MSATPRPTEFAPADLESTLSLLTRLIAEIQAGGLDTNGEARIEDLVSAVRARPQLVSLPSTLLRVYNEIVAALSGIRQTREHIQHHALDQLRDTQDRLSQVSTTTESAALEMLNGLDRTLALVDTIETGAPGADHIAAVETLRNEINNLFGHLQFQDIITQQLRGITDLVEDVEARMGRVADLLDQSLSGPPSQSAGQDVERAEPSEYNPGASWEHQTEQSEIDAAFSKPK
ncbi:MAG: hypothetical protein ABIZ70_01785 [Gemmatimonadales bacterium]